MDLTDNRITTLREVADRASARFWGQRETVEFTLTAFLARGHVLFEDVPGVGKTTLAHTLAQLLGLSFKRVQFTSDLLPADVIGVSIYNPGEHLWETRQGPIFTNILVADEINRAPPRTQSGLLEAMQEGKVSLDRETFDLPEPFWVIATQNPLEQHGTYPLPESQLDRFLLKLSLGYPPKESELAQIISPQDPLHPVWEAEPLLSQADLLWLQREAVKVDVHEDLGNYLLELVEETRVHARLRLGASPRAALGLARVARANALLAGRDYVEPDDIRKLFIPTMGHRVHLKGQGSTTAEQQQEIDSILKDIANRVSAPV